jgi:hypothetical protein
MKKGGTTCSSCGAGFQRLELLVEPRTKGEYRCPACNQVLETFDGSKFIAYRRMTCNLSNKIAAFGACAAVATRTGFHMSITEGEYARSSSWLLTGPRRQTRSVDAAEDR